MNWITTNIRLPEDLYMDLKMKAARQRKSVAAVIREKIGKSKGGTITRQKKRAAILLRRLDKFRERTAKENKGINLTKALIEMRYEQ